MFVSFTVFPGLLAAPPFSLSPTAVGAAYLPIGVALLLGSLCGGGVSDAAGRRRPGAPTARLLPSLAGACALPLGALIFGWTAWGAGSSSSTGSSVSSAGALAGILVGHALIGAGQSVYGPGFFAYLSGASSSAPPPLRWGCM